MTKNIYLRLLYYFLCLFVVSVIVFIPVVVLFPNIVEESGGNLPNSNGDIDKIIRQFAMAAGVLVSTYFFQRHVEKRNLGSLGFAVDGRGLMSGFAVGVFVMFGFVLVSVVAGTVSLTWQTVSSHLFFALGLYFFVAIAEEVIFRGYVLWNLRQRFSDWTSILLSSLLFSLLHLFNDHFSMMGFVNIFLAGILYAVVFIRTRSILYAIGLHWSWNFVQGPVFGFAVSGHRELGVFSVEPLSNDFLTGGEFGAEGSVLLTVVAIGAIVLFHFYGVNKE